VTYEMARYLDARARDDRRGEPVAWSLRKNVAGLAGAIERYVDPRQSETAGEVMMQLMARMLLLNQVMRENVGALGRYIDHGSFPGRDDYPGLHFFAEWLPQVPDLAIDRDFEKALAQPLADLTMAGESGRSLTGLIRELLDEDFDFPWRKGVGAHHAALVTTIVGDHSSLLEAERCARETARSLGLKPVPGLPSVDDAGDVFRIHTCRPEEIGRLFHENVLGPDARGCIIIDGVRTLLAPRTDLPPDPDGGQRLATMHDFVGSRLAEALNAGRRAAYHLCRQEGGKVGPGAGAGPRLMWVGIDYRELGVPAGSSAQAFSGELWAILGRSHLLMGVDAAKLLSGETTAFAGEEKDA